MVWVVDNSQCSSDSDGCLLGADMNASGLIGNPEDLTYNPTVFPYQKDFQEEPY